MNLSLLLPFLASAIMAYFAVSVLQRWAARRASYFLFWGIGLAMYAAASFSEAFLAVAPFNHTFFFLWYVGGAALTAAWIGQGTLMLLVRTRWIRRVTTALLIGGSLIVIALMLSTPLDPARAVAGQSVSEWYRFVMPPRAPIRLSTPFFNIYGVATIVGGALWSSYLFWRKRVMPDRVMGNVLIAVGALVIASASTLTRFGLGDYLYVGELLAAILMFAGFRLAAAPTPSASLAPAEAGA